MANQLPRPVVGYVSAGNTGDREALASWFCPTRSSATKEGPSAGFSVASDLKRLSDFGSARSGSRASKRRGFHAA